jgi:hypothetical protein
VRDFDRIKARLEGAPPNTPVSLEREGGNSGDFGMKLALLSPTTAVHSAWLSVVATEARRDHTDVELLGFGQWRPFGQFTAAVGGDELLLLANGPNGRECLLRFVVKESSFDPENFDIDGYWMNGRRS